MRPITHILTRAIEVQPVHATIGYDLHLPKEVLPVGTRIIQGESGYDSKGRYNAFFSAPDAEDLWSCYRIKVADFERSTRLATESDLTPALPKRQGAPE